MKKLYVSRLISCVLVILITSIFSININAQQIGVLGNSQSIADDDITPSPSDHTDFENNTSRVFSIDNIQSSGRSTLTISTIELSFILNDRKNKKYEFRSTN